MTNDSDRPAGGPTKPVIFISYSHKDEPDHPRDGEIQWLSFVRTYLQPAIKNGIFDLFVDEHLIGGDDLKPEIERKLRACDVFIPLVSANSTSSDYIVDTEIMVTRDRESKGEDVCFYPVLLTPTPKVALDKFKDKVIRPRDAKPLSSFPYGERMQKMTEIADEVATIAAEISNRKPLPLKRGPQPSYVYIDGLPETPYERLVGRDGDLKRLDDAWADGKTNIISLIAEGGAGKSALANEWLKRMQADNYRGAVAVLGWSFYSQGTKERATSAEGFLNWALDKLDIKLDTTSAAAKAEAIAEALMQRRVLLILDGVEPLQHGLDAQQGELKDQGLRALLRRFAATPPAQAHGLIVLTSRLPVMDISRWKDGAAPVMPVDKLPDEAGAALLRDNGVWGTDKELKAAAHDFDGHPLGLGLLASFLKETQFGDVRRRDHVRAFFADPDNPRHDHAKRVMESYEKEWFKDQPVLLAIMYIVGLFDRPASGDCLQALRNKPSIAGLTDQLVELDENEWQRAIVRLREVQLLSPVDPSMPDALDAHPLVREWFGERLEEMNEAAWGKAHGRLYEHLRDTTKEDNMPTLAALAPLYQAITHGCRANRYEETFEEIILKRIWRIDSRSSSQFYSIKNLGALGSDLSALSLFFEKPYEELNDEITSWAPTILGNVAYLLRAQGRFTEALAPDKTSLALLEARSNWGAAAIVAANLRGQELLLGEIDTAIATARRSVSYADRSGDDGMIIFRRTDLAECLEARGQTADAERYFVEAERRQKKWQPKFRFLYSFQGYRYCDLFLRKSGWAEVRQRSRMILKWEGATEPILDRALVRLSLARALSGLALENKRTSILERRRNAESAQSYLDKAVEYLRAAAINDFIPRGLLARAASRRSIGNWGGAARDLDEVEEIAEPGPMKLLLCDMAIERARLAFAQIESFAPLNGMLEKDNPPKPDVPSAEEIARLKEEATRQLKIAADYIEGCGYHRRDEELAELQAVLRGERKFADLPPRV